MEQASAAAQAELARERLELEMELDLLRARAAELQEAVQQQKLEISGQRTEISAELHELRRLAELQAKLFAEREAAAPVAVASPPLPTASPVAIAAPGEAQPGADPVVNSVMAQFAKLQKDVAQRRKNR